MELTEQDANDLNDLLDYALEQPSAFALEFYLKTIKEKPSNDDLKRYAYLLNLARYLMKKYDQNWFRTIENSLANNINTKPFLDQGGFINILGREQQEQRIKDLTETQLSQSIFQLKYWWVFIIINLAISLLVAWLTKGWK